MRKLFIQRPLVSRRTPATRGTIFGNRRGLAPALADMFFLTMAVVNQQKMRKVLINN
jgi:hypothetical protein